MEIKISTMYETGQIVFKPIYDQEREVDLRFYPFIIERVSKVVFDDNGNSTPYYLCKSIGTSAENHQELCHKDFVDNIKLFLNDKFGVISSS